MNLDVIVPPPGVYVKQVGWHSPVKEWVHWPLNGEKPEPRFVILTTVGGLTLLIDVNAEPSRPVTRYRKHGNVEEASPSPVTRTKNGRRYKLCLFALEPPLAFTDERLIQEKLYQASLDAPTLSIEAKRLSIFAGIPTFHSPVDEFAMDTFGFGIFTPILSTDNPDIAKIRMHVTQEHIVLLTLCCIADRDKTHYALYERMFLTLACALDQYSIPLETCRHEPHTEKAKKGRYDWTHATTCLGIDLLSCVPSGSFVEERSLVGGLWLPGTGVVDANRVNRQRVRLLMSEIDALRVKMYASAAGWAMLTDIRHRIGPLHVTMQPASEHVCVADYPSIKRLLSIKHPKNADRLIIGQFVSSHVPVEDRHQFLLGLPISDAHRKQISSNVESIDKHGQHIPIDVISDRAFFRLAGMTSQPAFELDDSVHV